MPKPRRIKKGEPGYGKKKFVVKGTHKGKPYTVRFGDPNMEIRRDNPKAKKNFRSRHNCSEKNVRSRHNCSEKKDPTKAGYWSCKMWSSKKVSDVTS